ncbi:MAG: hypothetical protein IAE81_02520 [Caldilineaceae bacterium]|jgi:putative transposase|nr:hypothetical protein [Caldilineaceae bacterium]
MSIIWGKFFLMASNCQIRYHWLIRQDGDVSARYLVQYVLNTYVKTFNARHQNTGTLFEGPYHARLIDCDEYLLHLCRYIHANPVSHGFAAAPDLWPYSNFLDWIGQRPGTLVDRTFIRTHFSNVEQYAASIQAYLQTRTMPSGLSRYLDELEE